MTTKTPTLNEFNDGQGHCNFNYVIKTLTPVKSSEESVRIYNNDVVIQIILFSG